MLFHSRNFLIKALSIVIDYEVFAVDLKEAIDKHSDYKIPENDLRIIKDSAEKVFSSGTALLNTLHLLRETQKAFKMPFVFKKKDYANYVKTEMSEIRNLISVMKVKPKQLTNSQPNLMLNGELEIAAEEEKQQEEEDEKYSVAGTEELSTHQHPL